MTRRMTGSRIRLLALLLPVSAAGAGLFTPVPSGGQPWRDAPNGVAQDDTIQSVMTEPDVLTLRDALSLALQRSPALTSWPWELRALEAESQQASRRPNPRTGVLAENIATENLETSLQISQLVELGGKRGRRVALARAERETANWSFESTRADVVTITARRFVEALAAQERISIERELVNVAQETAEAVSMRVRAGGASSVEETRAQVAFANARAALASAEHERLVAYQRLASMWANPKPRFSEVRGDLTSTPAPLALDTLLARIDRNPDVARWAAEISLRERLHASVRASRVPDLDLDFGVRRLGASDETGLLIGASIPIPIFDRAQDATAAAELRIRGATEQQAAAREQASAAVAVAHAELAAALDAHQRLQNEVLPQAMNAHEAATSAYRSGLMRFTDVLDVHRTLFEVRIRSIDMLIRYHTAAFEIERLTGSPVAGPSDKEQQ